MRNQHNLLAQAAKAAMTSKLAGRGAHPRMLAACAVASIAVIAAVTPGSAGGYVYTQIQVDQNSFSCATGINAQNAVVGEYSGIGSAPFGGYLSGVFSPIAPPFGIPLAIDSVNNQGNFVATYSGAQGPTAFLAVCPAGTGICTQ